VPKTELKSQPMGIARGCSVLRRCAPALWAAAALCGLLGTTPAAYYYGAPLFTEPDARPSDVIVLLSSGQLDTDWLTPDAAQRLLGALKLYREGYAPAIISSGSQHASGRDQAELQARWLERAGVPAAALIVENTSTRTYESAMEVRRMMERRGWKSAAVVTSQMDVPRVRLVFRKLGVAATFLPVPEFKRPRGLDYLRSAAALSYHATYEYLGLVFYKWKGWI
jgi:uncharacterized SAM-binding protein YcdF (DUF218 family)